MALFYQHQYFGLFKVIFYFPNGKSTIWGIYSEYFLFFGHPLSKSIIDEANDNIDGLWHWFTYIVSPCFTINIFAYGKNQLHLCFDPYTETGDV